jgi:hypothetical protein
MTMRERQPGPRDAAAGSEARTEEPRTDDTRAAGDAFLDAADAAIAQALSATPEDFLSQNRQLGGE